MPANGSNDQWGWPDMEELLQCPICFESPTQGVVEQCKSGHHICSVCKPKVDKCPLCKCVYPGTRNFVIEELMRNLETLKNTMLLNAISLPPTQSKKKQIPKEIPEAVRKRQVLITTPVATKGCYPCLLNACDAVLPASRMLNHVRSCHSKFYNEGTVNDDGKFKITFNITTSSAVQVFRWQRVFFVSGIGLMYFTYVLLKNGYLIAFVQMIAKCRVAQNYKCELVIRNQRGIEYKEVMKLTSTREKMENLLYREECMILNKRQTKILKQLMYVNCALELSKVKENDSFQRNYTRIPLGNLNEVLSFYNQHTSKKSSKRL